MRTPSGRAFRDRTDRGRPGPVLVDIPKDVTGGQDVSMNSAEAEPIARVTDTI